MCLVASLLLTPHTGGADTGEQRQADPPLPAVPPVEADGSLSIGAPEAGLLIHGLRMPESAEWVLADPEHAWGTEETIRSLMLAVRRVREQFHDTPAAVIGSISAQFGGPYPPHQSHRTGRDADIHFFLVNRNTQGWYERATRGNLDRARTWALLKSVVTETLVDFVLIDREVQRLLIEHSLSVGEDAGFVRRLFHGCGRIAPIIQHAPEHAGHMHIRFTSPVARERGRRQYDRLVRQGRIRLPVRQVEHVVEPGDTLLKLANRYRTSIASIRQLNRLGDSSILPPQKLTIEERLGIPGARAPIELRPMPSLGSDCSDGAR
jgi:penicillin-insensitive murein endopeptidase